MGTIGNSNVIRVFEFYLAAMLILGLIRRWSVYQDTFLLAIAVRGRWPKLVERMARQKKAILNWPTLRPVVLVLVLMLVQMVASRLIWPQAKLSLSELPQPWWQLVPFFLTLFPMLTVDSYFLINVGGFDREVAEKYFDQAESWAGSWKARAVKVFTLGKINPDRMVNEEVQKGLVQLGKTMTWAMWWVSIQVGCRLLFGLTIWILWAVRSE
jgi:hypothetical protein